MSTALVLSYGAAAMLAVMTLCIYAFSFALIAYLFYSGVIDRDRKNRKQSMAYYEENDDE